VEKQEGSEGDDEFHESHKISSSLHSPPSPQVDSLNLHHNHPPPPPSPHSRMEMSMAENLLRQVGNEGGAPPPPFLPKTNNYLKDGFADKLEHVLEDKIHHIVPPSPHHSHDSHSHRSHSSLHSDSPPPSPPFRTREYGVVRPESPTPPPTSSSLSTHPTTHYHPHHSYIHPSLEADHISSKMDRLAFHTTYELSFSPPSLPYPLFHLVHLLQFLFYFILFCFVLFCFALLCFVLCYFILFCFVLC
jgi:hypothetical protein